MWGVDHQDLVLCLLWEIKETWDVPDKIVDDLLWHGVVLQVEKADIDESMSELFDELGLMSLVIGEGKVEDWDAGEVGSHRECQGCVRYLNKERRRLRRYAQSAQHSHRGYDAMMRRYRAILSSVPPSPFIPSIYCYNLRL